MEQVLLVIHVIIAAALIGVVLIQRSDTDGFGLGSGGGSGFMTGRATANLLTRTTAILAALFMANALLLSIIASHHGSRSIADQITQEQTDAPGVPVPVSTDAESGAVETGLNRDEVVDTDKAAKKAVAKKSAKKAAAEPATTSEDAPAVPTAE